MLRSDPLFSAFGCGERVRRTGGGNGRGSYPMVAPSSCSILEIRIARLLLALECFLKVIVRLPASSLLHLNFSQ